jgi:uncharacterized protein (UPF0332 family)
VSLHSDLIEQAEYLAKREPTKPRQASLRRSISTAYYALFHMLINDGALKFVPNSPVWLRDQAQRAFTHGEMRNACEVFSKSPKTYAHLLVPPLEAELQSVAAAFVELQQLRHAADYDLSQTFDRSTVLRVITLAKTAMTDWRRFETHRILTYSWQHCCSIPVGTDDRACAKFPAGPAHPPHHRGRYRGL